MKLSKAITELERLKEQHGDIDLNIGPDYCVQEAWLGYCPTQEYFQGDPNVFLTLPPLERTLYTVQEHIRVY